MDVNICQETRLCKVGEEYGYFHTWEHYSKPLPESPLVGGKPAGVFSQVFGIVEFHDGVRRIDPTQIKFHDDVCVPDIKGVSIDDVEDNCSSETYDCDRCVRSGNCPKRGKDGKPRWMEEEEK